MGSNKRYLLDTNVLIYDIDSIYNFGSSEVLISDLTIEELDKFKVEHTERGYDSRQVTNKIKKLLDMEGNEGKTFKEGVICNKEGGKLRIIHSKSNTNLSVDKRLIEDAKDNNATLLVRDNNLFLLASGNVDVEYYKADSIKTDSSYTGYKWVFLSIDDYMSFMKNGYIEESKLDSMHENEFALISLYNFEDTEKIIEKGNPEFIGIKKKDKIIKLDLDKWLQERYNGLVFRPKNLEQKLLMYLILNEDINVVTVSGASGKGKTALAIDFSKNYTEKGVFSQYIYTKSVIDSDKSEELGFIKGGLLEKFLPNLKPLNYTLESIENEKILKNKLKDKKDSDSGIKDGNSSKKLGNIMEDLDIMDNKYILNELQKGLLQLLPLAKIRGMTIDNKAVVLDEGQNVKRHTMKSFISRIKDNSKVIITGDNDQIDDFNLNKYNNGFTHLIEKGKGQENTAHITLDISKNTQRGKISEFANEYL